MNNAHKILLVAIGAFSLAALLPAKAQLIITEVMSNEKSSDNIGTGGQAGSSDWFEVTNFGPAAISTSNLTMADSSGSGSAQTALRLSSGSIGVGQSIVFIEDGGNNDTTLAQQFETSWFGNDTTDVPADFQIGFYTAGSKGISFSSGGDSVNVFQGSTQISGVSFGSATTGDSFDNSVLKINTTGTDGKNDASISALSVVGTDGAVETSHSEIGSPGFDSAFPATPEPGTYALLFAGLGMLFGFQKMRRNKLS